MKMTLHKTEGNLGGRLERNFGGKLGGKLGGCFIGENENPIKVGMIFRASPPIVPEQEEGNREKRRVI